LERWRPALVAGLQRIEPEANSLSAYAARQGTAAADAALVERGLAS
jgi:hypothetical protein